MTKKKSIPNLSLNLSLMFHLFLFQFISCIFAILDLKRYLSLRRDFHLI